jgi:hypothetical protein
MAVSPEQRCPGPHSSAGSALPAAGGWVGPSCSFWRICNERLLAIQGRCLLQENPYSPTKDPTQDRNHCSAMVEESAMG